MSLFHNFYYTANWDINNINKSHLKREVSSLDWGFILEFGDSQFYWKLNLSKTELTIFIAQLEPVDAEDNIVIQYRCIVKDAKDVDSSNELIKKGFLSTLTIANNKNGGIKAGRCCEILLDELLDDDNKLLKHKSLTITIHLMFHSCDGIVDEKNIIPKAYAKYFNSQELSDLKIIVSNKVIPAHKPILYSTASPIFCKMLQSKMGKSNSDRIKMDENNVKVVFELIRFLYTGCAINMTEISWDLLELAEKYELPALKVKCINAISLNLKIENVLSTLDYACVNDLDLLRRNCIGFIKMQLNEIKKTDQWKKLNPKFIKMVKNSQKKKPHAIKEFNNSL